MKDGFEKRGYLQESFRLFHLNSSGQLHVDFHYHEFCKVLMLCSGSGGYTVEGKRYSLQAGDVVLLGSRCVHRPEFSPDSPYERIIIYIDPTFLQEHSATDCDLTELFSGEGGHVLRCSESRRQKMFSMARELETELDGEEFGKGLVSRGQLLRLLVEIGRNLRGGGDALAKPVAPNDERIRGLLEYIDGHLSEELSVEDLAEQVFLSKYHLMRKFKSEVGLSLHEYIAQRRLILARDLIARGETVTDACFQVGYRSYSSFFRAYVKLFGMTPTGKSEAVARESSYE